MTDDPYLTEDEIGHIFHLVRTNSDPSVHAHLESLERLYRIERARHAVARIRLMHAQASLDVVYGHRVQGDLPARRATDLKAV